MCCGNMWKIADCGWVCVWLCMTIAVVIHFESAVVIEIVCSFSSSKKKKHLVKNKNKKKVIQRVEQEGIGAGLRKKKYLCVP